LAGGRNGMTEICKDHVMVLGTRYSIEIKSKDSDSMLENRAAYVYYSGKQIVLRDMIKEWTQDPVKFTIKRMRESLRHEIIHAFLFESGLHESSTRLPDDGWATNEEMVDWFAIQAPKIFRAMKEAKCL
jgi:hypothetical protein